MSKRTSTASESFRSILSRAMNNGGAAMAPAFARRVLTYGFSPADQERIADLMERNQAGVLPPAEKAELDEFARVGTFLSILQAQARLALKRTAKAKS
jgi:hypothetical protein